MITAAASLAARGCPRECRSALSIGAPPELELALQRLGLAVHRESAGSDRVGVVVACVAGKLDETLVSSLRGRMARRGRFFALCRARQLPDVLTALARCGLHPKRLLLPEDGGATALVVGAPGRPGGLVVERLGSRSPET